MGGNRTFAEPRAQTNRFDKRNGNKNCNSESDFNVARQVSFVKNEKLAHPPSSLCSEGG